MFLRRLTKKSPPKYGGEKAYLWLLICRLRHGGGRSPPRLLLLERVDSVPDLVQDALELHHADRQLLGLQRDVFERLVRYRRERSLPSWEHVIERLLAQECRR